MHECIHHHENICQLKSVKYVSATKSELESGNAASHSLPKDKGTRAMIDAKAEAVAARSVALLLQV